MQKGCRANANPAVVAEKMSRVHSGPGSAINAFVDLLKTRRPGCDIPYVDPDYGGVDARILLLLQDPGPKASSRGSKMLSISNDDPTAQTVCELLAEASIPWKDVIAWNAVPWYTGGGNSASDIADGLRALVPFTDLLKNMQVVITFGGLASSSWEKAVVSFPGLRRFKQVATLHPSVRGQTRGSRQSMAVGRAEILGDLIHARSLLR